MVERPLPKRRNPLVAPGSAPSYEDLLARRRLGKTKLTVKPGQVGTSNATKAENLGPFEYAHLRAPLPADLKGSEIFAVQANQPPPETYFLMRRSKDGFVSATGMFKIAFPWAALAEERAERAYLKTLAATSQDEVAGNIWVEPVFALALAHDYGLSEWIRALLDPTDIAQSPSNARKQIAPPPKFELPPSEKRKEAKEQPKATKDKAKAEVDRTKLPPPSTASPGPVRSRLRSASPSKVAAASPAKKPAASPRKRQTKKEKEAAIANANAASASLQSALDNAASVESTTTSPALNGDVVKAAVVDEQADTKSAAIVASVKAEQPDDQPVALPEPPSAEDTQKLLESARQMVAAATTSTAVTTTTPTTKTTAKDATAPAKLDSAPKIRRKRKAAETEAPPAPQPVKKTKVQQEEVVKRDKVRTRALVGVTATLAIAAAIPYVSNFF